MTSPRDEAIEVIDLDVSGAGGGGKGGGGGKTPKEDKNDLQARASARIIDLISEGEIVGLVDGARSIYFNETPLENADGSVNFEGVFWSERLGTPDQEHIPGFEAAGNEIPIGTEIKKEGTGAVVQTIAQPNLDAIRVTIQTPMFADMQKDGDIKRTEVDLVIEVQPNGGSYKTVKEVKIKGKTLSPYERSIRIDLPKGGSPWNVRVSRLTKDATEDSRGHHNRTFWARYTEIIDAKLTYPNSAYIGLLVDAEEFGSSIPARAYDVKGLLVRIPNNYDPDSRTYAGVWNGGFTLAWTNNPAWVFYDLATNPRYGLGEYLTDGQVDKWALYQVAQYCDQLVPDGFGGQEPRFTFNGVINSQEEAYRCLQAIASAFRGMTYFATGAISVVADQPRDPIKLVAPADVINGEFTYSGTSLRARHTVAHVVWNDPDDNYRPAIEVVEAAPEIIARYGYREKRVIAYGCTSRGQAHRFGKWILYSEQEETETVTYQAAWDHVDIVPGDIIKVFDPSYAGVRFGGRLVSVAANLLSAELDSPVELASGESYSISITMPDGSLVDRAISNAPGTHTTITWSGALPETPVKGALFGITGTDLEPRQFRVLAIRELEESAFEVTALLHNPFKFAHIEQNIQLPPIPYQRPANEIGPPGPITVQESVVRVNGLPQIRLNVSWELSPDAAVRFYEAMVLVPGGSWQHHHPTRTNGFEMFTEPGPHTIRVRSGGDGNKYSNWVETDYTVAGQGDAPEKVEGVTTFGGVKQITVTWAPVNFKDVDYEVWGHSEILSGPDSNIIQNATKLVEVRSTAFAHGGLPPMAERWYWVRAVTFGGVPGPFSEVAYGKTELIDENTLEESVRELMEDLDLQAIEPVYEFPGAGSPLRVDGKLILYVPEKKIYRWDEGAGEWVPLIADIEAGQVEAIHIAANTIGQTHFADGLTPVGVVNGLPDPSEWDGPQIVTNEQDGKLYQIIEGEWQSVIANFELEDEMIENRHILDGAIDELKLAANAVTAAKIATGAVLEEKLANDAITAEKIRANAVSTEHLQDELITAEKLVANAVTEAKLAANAVTEEKLANAAVTAQKIAQGAIDATKFASGISAPEIKSTLPTTGNFEGRLVFLETDGKLYRYHDGGWTAAVPAADLSGLIEGSQLVDEAITAVKLADEAVEAAKIATGAVLEEKLANAAVTAGKIAANAISTENLQDELITAEKLVANAVTEAKLAASAVTERHLADAAITASKIRDEAIDATKFARNIAAPQIVSSLPVFASDPKAIALDGDSNTYATAPHDSAYDITGDIVIRARIWPSALPNFSHGIIGKSEADGTYSYQFEIHKSGALRFNWNANTLQSTASTNPLFDEHGPLWVAAAFDADDGAGGHAVRFYWSVDGQSWTQLGGDVTGAGAETIRITEVGLLIGRRQFAPHVFNGKIYEAQVYDGLGGDGMGGTLVAAFNAEDAEFDGTSFNSASTGETWTLNGSARIVTENQGKLALLESDGKVYRYDQGQWTAAVPTTDLSGLIEGQQLVDEAITAAKLSGEAVEAAKIKDGAVVSEKLAEAAVIAGKIAENAITTENLQDELITAQKIVANAVTEAKLAANAVTEEKLANAAVTAQKIAQGAVDATKFAQGLTPPEVKDALPASDNFEGRLVYLTTDGKLYRYHNGSWTSAVSTADLSGLIQTEQLVDEAITAVKIATDAIEADKIKDSAITASKVAANAIEAGKIAANAVNSDQIAANAVITAKLANSAVNAAKIAANAVTQAKIAANAVTARQIAEGAVGATAFASNIAAPQIVSSLPTSGNTEGRLVVYQGTLYRYHDGAWTDAVPTTSLTGTITATQITDSAITTPKLNANAVTAAKIATDAIQARHIVANAITAGAIAAGAVGADQIQANAIGSDQIAANAISAKQLVIGDFTNLIPNPRFEQNNTDGWHEWPSSWSTGSRTNRMPTRYAGRMDLDNENDQTAYIHDLPTVGGEKLYFAMAIASEGSSPREVNVQLVVDYYDQYGDPVSSETADYTQTNIPYSIFEHNIVVPEEATNMSLGIRRLAGGSGTGWFSDIQLRRIYGSTLIADGAITAEKVSANAINANHLAANSVTASQIAANAVTASQIAANAVKAVNIEANAVTTAKIATNAVTANEIAANAVKAAQIDAGAVTAGAIAANAVVAGKIDTGAVTADTIATNAVIAAKIQANAVTTAKIATNAVRARQIQANAVNADKIAANSVGTDHLIANSVTAGQIAAGAVGADQIAANAISADKIAANAVTASHLAIGDFSNLVINPEFANGSTDGWSDWPSSWSVVERNENAGYGAVRNAPRRFIASCPLSGSNQNASALERLAVSPGESIHVSFEGASGGGSRDVTFRISRFYYRADDTLISSTGTNLDPITTTSWVNRELTFTVISDPDVAYVRIAVRRNAGGEGTGYFTNFRVHRLTPSVLIEDGAITAEKIVANAINAAHLSANAVHADHIGVNTIAADHILANAVTSEKILANAVQAEHVAANAITARQLAITDFTNLVPNPQFVDGTPHSWVTWPSAWDVIHKDEDGSSALSDPPSTFVGRVDAHESSSGFTTAYALRDQPVKPGETFFTSIDCATGGSSPRLARCQIIFRWFDNEGSAAGANFFNFQVTALGWNTFSDKATAPSNAVTLRLEFRRYHDGPDSGVLYFTNFHLRRMTGSTLIEDGAITTEKLTANAVTANELAAGAVLADHIQANAIDAVHVNAGAIGTSQLAANAITSGKIKANAVTADAIAANSVGTDHLIANSVTAGAIAAGAVGADQIAANAITSDKIAANAISAKQIAIGDFENICKNPQFQGGNADGWDSWPSEWNIVARNPNSGTSAIRNAPTAYVAQATSPSSGSINAYIVRDLPVKPGERIYVSFDAASSGSSPTTVFRVRRYYRDAEGAGAGSGNTDFTRSGTAYTTYETSFTTTNSSAATVEISIRTLSSGTTTGYFTNVRVYKMTPTVLIEDGAITAEKVSANAINANHLSANSVTASQIAANAVTASQIATNAVTTAKLAANAVTAAKIAASTITGNEIAANTIAGGKLIANTISTREIAASAVKAAQIDAGAVTAGKIAAGAVNASNILTNNIVVTDKINANAITAAKIASNAVQARQIQANAVNADKIAANSILTGHISAGAVNTSQLAANAITSDKIAANAITANKLAVNSVTAGAVAAGAIAASAIQANAVVAGKIASNAIQARHISANSISATEISANTIRANNIYGSAVNDTYGVHVSSQTVRSTVDKYKRTTTHVFATYKTTGEGQGRIYFWISNGYNPLATICYARKGSPANNSKSAQVWLRAKYGSTTITLQSASADDKSGSSVRASLNGSYGYLSPGANTTVTFEMEFTTDGAGGQHTHRQNSVRVMILECKR